MKSKLREGYFLFNSITVLYFKQYSLQIKLAENENILLEVRFVRFSA